MAEEPVQHHARLRGQSKYGISRSLRVVVDLLAVFFFLRFGTRPGHFFGVLGLGVMMVGMALLSYLGVLKLLGESIGGRPLLLLGFFSILGGLQFLTTGVLAELLMRVYFEGRQVRPYQRALHTAEADPAPERGWSQTAP